MKKLGLQITLALVLAVVLIGCEQHATEEEGLEEEVVRNEEIDQEAEPVSPPEVADALAPLGLEEVVATKR